MNFIKKIITSIKSDGKSYLAEITLKCFPTGPTPVEVIDMEIVDVEDGGDILLIGEKVHWDLTQSELDRLADEAFGYYNCEEYLESKLDFIKEGG